MSPSARTDAGRAPARRPVASGSAARPPAREAAGGGARPRPTRAVEPLHRRRVLLWSLAVVVVLVVVAVGAAFSPLLAIETVTVVGAPTERVGEVRAAAGVDEGDSVVAFRTGAVEGRLRDLPWVEGATVTRELPHAVRIEVVPRVPVGWAVAGSRVIVVDADSRVLYRAEAPPAGVPELVGLAELAGPGGSVGPRTIARAAGALGPELRLRSATVGVRDGALTVQVIGGPEIRFGAVEALAMKARVAASVLAAIGATPVRYIDVSVPAAPVSG